MDSQGENKHLTPAGKGFTAWIYVKAELPDHRRLFPRSSQGVWEGYAKKSMSFHANKGQIHFRRSVCGLQFMDYVDTADWEWKAVGVNMSV